MKRIAVRAIIVTFLLLFVFLFFGMYYNVTAPPQSTLQRRYRAGCLGNLKMIDIALMQYRNEHDGHYPNKNGIEGLYMLVDEGFLDDIFFLVCPAHRSKPRFPKEYRPAEEEISYEYVGGKIYSNEKKPLVWDKEPYHDGLRAILFKDGTIDFTDEPIDFENK